MKTIGLFLCVLTLSGCAEFEARRYLNGYRDGRDMCRDGRQDKTSYKAGFYDGFLIENLSRKR